MLKKRIIRQLDRKKIRYGDVEASILKRAFTKLLQFNNGFVKKEIRNFGDGMTREVWIIRSSRIMTSFFIAPNLPVLPSDGNVC